VRIILDNCVPYGAKALFPNHQILHARDLGWRHLSNGDILFQVSRQFEVFVTTDKDIRHEHNLSKLPIPVVECNTRLTRIEDLRTLAPYFEVALARTKDFWFVSIDANGNLECLGPRH
jgi:hypothetical protein